MKRGDWKIKKKNRLKLKWKNVGNGLTERLKQAKARKDKKQVRIAQKRKVGQDIRTI